MNTAVKQIALPEHRSSGLPGDFACLAIETAGVRGSVALVRGGECFVTELAETATSSRQIFGLIEQLLSHADWPIDRLDCVAFGCGPGSFTGVRVAAGAAQGLAYAAELPVCRVSTLEALAFNALSAEQTATAGLVAAALDARMGEAYLGLYRRNDEGTLECVEADALVTPADTRLARKTDVALAAGPGWQAYPEMLEGFSGDVTPEVLPDAAAVAQLGHAVYAAGNACNAMDALPNYVRNEVTQ